MDKAPDPIMNRSVLDGFTQSRTEKGQQRKAQLDEKPPMDDLFKPEKKLMDKPDIDSDVSIDEEDGLDKDIKPEKKMSFDELKSAIESFEGTPDEIEELCDACQDKLMGTQDDDIDTEMDREEAEFKDDMKKDEPLGGGAMEGAKPPMPPASAPPSPMR